MSTNTRALVPLAEGFEEMEAVIVVDVLRRGGVEVDVAGLAGAGAVLGSRGVTVHAERDLDDCLEVDYDAVVLPGGMAGTLAMRDDERVLAAVRSQARAGRLVAAVCAAPLVLERAGLLTGRTATSHPSVADELGRAGVARGEGRIVCDGRVLTSLGPGTAMEFALAVVEELRGPGVAREVADAMCV
ncbi:MAG: DJ-1 family glyoxalase III [Planctomycetota bacterium]